MRANLLSLQNTASLMATTQQRLATGKKVNSALDNPTSYFAAQSLTSRAGDLSNLLDGMGQGIQSLTAATQGITSAESIVQQMQSVANSAMQSINASNASTSATLNSISNSTASLNSVVTNLTSTSTPPVSSGLAVGDNFSIGGTSITINSGETMSQLGQAISAATNGNVSLSASNTGKFSLTNSSSSSTYTFGDGTGTPLGDIFGTAPTTLAANSTTTATAALNANTVVAATASTSLFNTATFNTIAANSSNLVTTTGTTDAISSGATLTVTLGTGTSAATHTIKVSANGGADGGVSTVGDLLTQLNNISGVNASLDSTGKLSITATGGKALTLTDGSANGAFGTLGLTTGSTIAATNAAPSANYASQFDGLRSQLDQLVQDSGYQGTNLISGATNAPLKILFNSDANNPNELVVNSMDLTSSGMGVSATSGNWNSATDVTNTLSQLTTATSTLRDAASQLGSNLTTVQTRQSFTTTLINTLQDGAGDLTNADMNQESANMLALQTQQQLGTSSLSLASQAAQSVLKLFP
jgi:flagellin-like hook-associated protein FlgL